MRPRITIAEHKKRILAHYPALWRKPSFRSLEQVVAFRELREDGILRLHLTEPGEWYEIVKPNVEHGLTQS